MRLWWVTLARRFCRVVSGGIRTPKKRGRRIEASGHSGKSARWLAANDEDIATSKVVQGFTAMTHLLQTGSCAPSQCHVGERQKVGRATGICADKAASRTNHGRHLGARRSTWYLGPGCRVPAHDRFHDFFCSSLCEPRAACPWVGLPHPMLLAARGGDIHMSNTRPGSRGHPSHNRLVLSTREA